ncbi:DivIVA domain-containing protein [Bifidobacterium sp. ESL0819]|uniref:DivIVA domain-containing protein n=1 Tax=Bifidobacterium sp. ESL0819 TaxID=3448589 RepID=UPI004041DA99
MTLITPRDIRCRLFTTRGWLHQGYDADEVDALLDDAADSLEQVSRWALITHSRMHAISSRHKHRRRSLKRRRMAIKSIKRKGRK